MLLAVRHLVLAWLALAWLVPISIRASLVRGSATAHALSSASAREAAVEDGEIEDGGIEEGGIQVGACDLAEVDAHEITVRTEIPSVRDPRPVPEIAFELRLRCDHGVGGPVVSGRTDARGRALALLPSSLMEGASCGDPEHATGHRATDLYGLVVEDGYQRRWAFVREAEADGRQFLEVKLYPRAGATAYGRIVDAAGIPTSAKLTFQAATQSAQSKRFGGKPFGAQLWRGEFALHFESGAFGHLFADAGDDGTGRLENVALVTTSPPTNLAVTVRGPGRLRGRVESDLGSASPRVELLAIRAGIESGGERTARFEEAEGARPPADPLEFAIPEDVLLRGGGHVRASGRTDLDGRFDFAGLRAGRYHVWAIVEEMNSEIGRLYRRARRLTDEPIEAGGGEQRLVYGRPHVVVDLSDANGERWSGTVRPSVDGRLSLTGRAARVSRLGFPIESRDWTQLFVVRVVEIEGQPPVVGSPIDPVDPRAGGPFVYELDGGGQYLVGAFGAHFSSDWQRFEFAPGRDAVRIELRARTKASLGELCVDVESPNMPGRFWPRPGLVMAWLEPREWPIPIAMGDMRIGRGAFQFKAPPGTYRLIVSGTSYVDPCSGTALDRRCSGSVERMVVVQENERTQLHLALGPGARVEVELVGEPNESDREFMRRRYPDWEGSSTNGEIFEAFLHAATIVLREPRGHHESLTHFVERGEHPIGRSSLLTWFPLGRRTVSEVVGVGRYELIARMPGGREQRREVELTEGEVTRVRIEF